MEIFKWLDNPSLVSSYIVNDFRQTDESFYLNIEAHFVDQSILYIREFTEVSRRKYAFRWQKKSGNLIMRWDNAPHFPNLQTFPHHKHLSTGEAEPSHDISLSDVLREIENIIHRR
ncbi:toxin-antitoxin system TumE family protein [Dyadobacter crusticola]|uniref:toxin-antitoxin system TumE family protein n=1 Tax=Dyadobacter crusticola TaxID=292407 RepID=UPI0004E0F9E0|nr:DUF6516 family protein [Dyadobacter crusticola]